MKRRNIFLLSLVAVLVEIVYSLNALNEQYRFINSTLEDKYIVLFVILYIFSCVFTLFYWFAIHPDLDDSDRSKRTKYDEMFGRKSYSFLYSYHFLAFAAASFVTSSWAWFIMGVFMFIHWNYVRCKQNDYADEYELEIVKENAKNKPTVELD